MLCEIVMKKSLRRTLLDDAGRLRELKVRLEKLEEARRHLNSKITSAERELADAERRFETAYDQVARLGERTEAAAEAQANTLTRGKLPYRVLDRMRRDSTRTFTAGELASELGIRDVQQVRTALARLVDRGLVRRTDVKGEFTI